MRYKGYKFDDTKCDFIIAVMTMNCCTLLALWVGVVSSSVLPDFVAKYNDPVCHVKLVMDTPIMDIGQWLQQFQGSMSLFNSVQESRLYQRQSLRDCEMIILVTDSAGSVLSMLVNIQRNMMMTLARRVVIVDAVGNHFKVEDLDKKVLRDFANLILIQQAGQDGYSVYHICPYCDQGQLGTRRLLNWTPDGGFVNPFKTIEMRPIWRTRVANFEGMPLRIAMTIGAPGALDLHPNNKDVRGSGAEIEGAYFATTWFNMKPNFLMVPDYTWGVKRNNTWTGGIGMIVRDETDMAMPWYGQDADRLQAADFSFPFLYAGIAIQTHRPQPSLDWRSIFKPFSLLVWLVTLASVMSIVIFLLLSFKVEKLSLFEGLYLAFVPTLKQGLNIWPKNRILSVFLLLWVILASILSFAYSGSLMSSLTLPSHPRPIDTFDDLLKSDMIITYTHQSNTMSRLREQGQGTQGYEVYERINRQTFDMLSCPLITECLPYQPTWAFLQDSEALRRQLLIANKDPDVALQKYHISTETLSVVPMFWPYRPGAIFGSALSESIIEWSSFGLFKKWETDSMELARQLVAEGRHFLWSRQFEIETSDLYNSGSITILELTHLQATFYIILVGIGLSCITFLIEVCYLQRNK